MKTTRLILVLMLLAVAGARGGMTNVFLGTTANDHTGDSPAVAFEKVNWNFAYLSNSTAWLSNNSGGMTGVQVTNAAAFQASLVTNGIFALMTNAASLTTNGIFALITNAASLTTNGIFVVITNAAKTQASLVTNSTAGISVGTVKTTAGATTDSTLKVSTLEFQPYAVNNSWFADNVYYNGSNFKRRASGYGGLFYFQGQEGQFRFSTNGAAGSTFPGAGQVAQLKIENDGTVALGGFINNASGNYTGASTLVKPDGSTTNSTVTSSGFGFGSSCSNRLAVASIAVTASPWAWTNSIAGAKNAQVFGSGTGFDVGVNGTWAMSNITECCVILQPNEWISFTNSGGAVFLAKWKPF